MTTYQEIESKFLVSDLNSIEHRLFRLGAKLSQPRSFEVNSRYDTPDRRLSAESKVLRIRQNTKNWLTFKGPGVFEGIQIRDEIEFSISDITSAHLLLQALGYEVIQSYEKYRTVFILEHTQIMLDELPFGLFIEIEGNDLQAIRDCAGLLELNWELNIKLSYLEIYKKICNKFSIDCGDLTFKEFDRAKAILSQLDIFPAEKPD